jgi:hypothetical protein
MHTLDNLRKEAKRWLKALRAGDADALARFARAHPNAPAQPALRDVQFALARELGYAGWTALKDALSSRSEQLARDLVAAHDSADAGALQRLGDHYGRALTHDDVRAAVWSRVYEVRQRSSRGERHIEIAEARAMLARDAGFGNWTDFVGATSAGREAPGAPYQIDRKDHAISPRRVLTPGEWDSLIDVMIEQRIPTLRASEQMTDALLARIADLDHVTRLDLEGSRQLTDAGLQQLARMPQLTELDLSGCTITDRGLEVLRQLPNLRRFHLRWHRGISDAGLAHLAPCDLLESVDLMGSASGDGTLRALAGKKNLRRLKTGRLVTDAGLSLLHEFPIFKTWQGSEAHFSLMDADAGPNVLLLDGPFTNEGVAGLVGLDGLAALSFFWHTSAITPAALAPLVRLPNLAYLGCEGALCDDVAMQTISGTPRLRMLMAQGTVATDDGFVALSRSQSLEYLWGRECPNLTGRGFAALSRIPTLRGLGVSCKNVDDDALGSLPQFPSLRELMPMDVPDDGFRHVGRCTNLEALWCMYCRETTDIATEHIRGLTKLKTYYAGKTQITDRSLEILATMDSLERLMFWETQRITDEGVRLLARLPQLRELSLEGLPHVTPNVIAEFPSHVRVTHSP